MNNQLMKQQSLTGNKMVLSTEFAKDIEVNHFDLLKFLDKEFTAIRMTGVKLDELAKYMIQTSYTDSMNREQPAYLLSLMAIQTISSKYDPVQRWKIAQYCEAIEKNRQEQYQEKLEYAEKMLRISRTSSREKSEKILVLEERTEKYRETVEKLDSMTCSYEEMERELEENNQYVTEVTKNLPQQDEEMMPVREHLEEMDKLRSEFKSFMFTRHTAMRVFLNKYGGRANFKKVISYGRLFDEVFADIKRDGEFDEDYDFREILEDASYDFDA